MNNPTIKGMHKDQLVKFIEEVLTKLNEILDFYEKLNNGTEDNVAILKDIENKYKQIVDSYNELFGQLEGGLNKVAQLNQEVEEIKTYHDKLLVGEDSIESDIKDSQNYITEFYNFLFSDKDANGDIVETREDKVKVAIGKIYSFHESLIGDNGIEADIQKKHQELLEQYNDFFVASEGEEKSKLDRFKESMRDINVYERLVKNEIAPEIANKRNELDDLKKDIGTKKNEIELLLSNVVGASLGAGYLQSKEDYGKRNKTKYSDYAFTSTYAGKHVTVGKVLYFLRWVLVNTFYTLDNLIFRYIEQVLNYIVFILPLLVICLIFLIPGSMLQSFGIVHPEGLSPTEFILYKTTISLPLFWIAWFGQKNISIRRRMYEEYNHKYRVVQMYLMFSTNEQSYPLDKQDKKNLSAALVEVIKSNPAEHLGKGETMIDKLLERFYENGLEKNIIKRVVSIVEPKILSDIGSGDTNS